jgi:hypothetical protein
MTVLGDANGVLWRFGFIGRIYVLITLIWSGMVVRWYIMVWWIWVFVSCPNKCPFWRLCVEVLKRDI